MTAADITPVEHAAQFSLARGIHSVLRWIAARRVARAKRQALQSLLFAPEHRLRDIGITREQLVQAIDAQGRASRDQFWPN
jgi:uncharacterized protein YjiS (DUF1127 family)